MITISSLRYLSRVFEKPPTLLCNLLISSTSKCAFFHKSKLLTNNFKIEIKMPSLSPTMTEGTIVKWLKREGDSIEPGDVLCEIQTDKAIVGLETEEEGVLEKIIIPENTQNIQLGEIIAIILGEGQLDEKPSVDCVSTVSQSPINVSKSSTKISKSATNELLGPSVKKLLHEFDIIRTDIPSSGPKNNLLKGDVLKFIKLHNLKPFKLEQKPIKAVVSSKIKETYVDVPISLAEMESANQLIQSKMMMPHGYMSIDCTLDYIMNYLKEEGVSLNELIIKCALTSLKRVPKMNSMRLSNGQLQSSDSVNISMTHFNDGKFETSFIENADGLNLSSISEKIKVKLSKPSRSAFRISNLSALGITDFVEVVSPSDVAVLAVGGIRSVFEEGSSVKKMRVTLSFDNYVVGETEAGEFLETFKNSLENPLILMC